MQENPPQALIFTQPPPALWRSMSEHRRETVTIIRGHWGLWEASRQFRRIVTEKWPGHKTIWERLLHWIPHSLFPGAFEFLRCKVNDIPPTPCSRKWNPPRQPDIGSTPTFPGHHQPPSHPLERSAPTTILGQPNMLPTPSSPDQTNM